MTDTVLQAAAEIARRAPAMAAVVPELAGLAAGGLPPPGPPGPKRRNSPAPITVGGRGSYRRRFGRDHFFGIFEDFKREKHSCERFTKILLFSLKGSQN